ncbi:DUF1490 family protein [Nakamurella deserti]|uniref:DUF1490 family protein n=1 Tax=Nakamurella deserti TaxID=2164074 RepID=UPI000DBE474E|nr:DUF1490 family protein [Nakamurella deserti]
MLEALVGIAVVGAGGLLAMDALKDTPVGDALRDTAVTVTEAGMRGYAIVEAEVGKLVDAAAGVVEEARARAAAPAPGGAPA